MTEHQRVPANSSWSPPTHLHAYPEMPFGGPIAGRRSARRSRYGAPPAHLQGGATPSLVSRRDRAPRHRSKMRLARAQPGPSGFTVMRDCGTGTSHPVLGGFVRRQLSSGNPQIRRKRVLERGFSGSTCGYSEFEYDTRHNCYEELLPTGWPYSYLSIPSSPPCPLPFPLEFHHAYRPIRVHPGDQAGAKPSQRGVFRSAPGYPIQSKWNWPSGVAQW